MIGQAVLDYVMSDRHDPMFGCMYKAMTVVNNDDLATRCKVRDATKCIYAIKANSKLNNDMCLNLRAAFQNGHINLLINESDMEDRWSKSVKNWSKLTDRMRALLRLSYFQTSFLIDELINLDHEVVNGLVKVREKSGMRKDRYSSLQYNYYVVDQLKIKQRKNTNTAKEISRMLTIRKGKRYSAFDD